MVSTLPVRKKGAILPITTISVIGKNKDLEKIFQMDTQPMSSQSNTQFTIGLLLENLTDSRFANVWQGVLAATRQYGVNLRCFCVGSVQNKEHWSLPNHHKALCRLINAQELDGLLTFQWWHDAAWFEQICQSYAPLPIVNVMRHFATYPGVRIDNRLGTQYQFQHLFEEHGCRKIAYFLGPPNSASSQERYQSYQKMSRQYHLVFDANLVVPDLDGVGVQAVCTLLDERRLQPGKDVEAIATFNDAIALGAIDELRRRGIQVPYDIAVIGFDNQKEADFSAVPLTTVAIPWFDMGYQAVEMLQGWLTTGQPPEHRFVPPTLITRRSCGCHEPEILHVGDSPPVPAPHDIRLQPETVREGLIAQISPYIANVAASPQRWAEEIVKAFLTEILEAPKNPANTGEFLRIFEQQLQHIAGLGGNVDIGQDVISSLSQPFHAYSCEAPDMWQQAEILCQQGRIIVYKLARRIQLRKQTEAEQRAAIIREIGQRLITTFDVGGLMNVLTEELPRLGILQCYLGVHDDSIEPENRTTRLILGYSEQGRLSPEYEGRRFPISQLLPCDLIHHHGEQNFVIDALFFGERQLGVVVFGNGPSDGDLYHILRGEISSALQGALLVQEVQERDAALIREKYVIDTFMANVPDRIYFKDCDGRLLRVNTAYAARMGYHDPTDVIGKTDFDFFPHAMAQRIAEREQEIIRSGEPVINQEVQLVHQDGSPSGWAFVTKMPLRNECGEIIGIFGISRNITALKQVEQELIQYRERLEELVSERTGQLRRINERLHQSITERTKVELDLRSSERQYRMLAENVKDGIMIVQNAVVVFANTVLATMLGISAESLLGQEPETVFHWGAEYPASDSIRQVRLTAPDGRELWTEIEQTPIVWNGQSAVLLTVRDVTSRKHKEQQLEEERARLHQENITLRSNIKERFRFGPLVGKSLPMQQVYEVLISSASSDVNVLIAGESGTGKELIARTIHRVSARREQAFVPVNCASIPEALFEREFFGHRRGAFTGADRDRAGFFDRAHKGVLFLDEVTELTPGTQAKLLRVLQDGEYTPLGSNVAKQADVLIVTATNQDPQEEILHGHLRRDFFYRICVIEINVPPLRDRKDDLPLLIEHILEHCHQRQTTIRGNTPGIMPVDQTMLPGEFVQALYAYDWPGNVRELQNILQRYLATRDMASALSLISSSHARALSVPQLADAEHRSLTDRVQVVEKQIIADALARHRYRVEPTAAELEVNLRTLYRKIKQYGLLD